MDENTAGRQWQEYAKNGTKAKDSVTTVTDTWTTRGVKYDADKPRMDLLDSDALEGLAKVLTFGAGKYEPSNWRGGIQYSRLVAAALRHLTAFNRGEDMDPESGFSHIDHAACCLMFLSNFVKNRPDLDDRYKGVAK